MKGAGLCAATLLLLVATLASGFDLQGHRGARGLRPENTLPSFEVALDLGVTTLELDLHLSADDVPVVWHDPVVLASKCRVDPAATPPLPPEPAQEASSPQPPRVRSLTLAQLRKYRCDRNPDAERFPEQTADPTRLAGDDYRIATLAEVFAFAARHGPGTIGFNVETKRVASESRNIDDGFDGEAPGPFETAIARVVREQGLEERVVLQSFDHRSLWAMRRLEPRIRLAALTSEPLEATALEGLAARGASIWSPDHETLSASLVEAAHRTGLRVIPWTVNTRPSMERLIQIGVDGIITDRPDVAAGLVAARREAP